MLESINTGGFTEAELRIVMHLSEAFNLFNKLPHSEYGELLKVRFHTDIDNAIMIMQQRVLARLYPSFYRNPAENIDV